MDTFARPMFSTYPPRSQKRRRDEVPDTHPPPKRSKPSAAPILRRRRNPHHPRQRRLIKAPTTNTTPFPLPLIAPKRKPRIIRTHSTRPAPLPLPAATTPLNPTYYLALPSPQEFALALYDPDFGAKVRKAYASSRHRDELRHLWREQRCGIEVARLFPPGETPQEVRQAYERAQEEGERRILEGWSSDEG